MFSRYFLAFCVVALLAVAVTAKAVDETATEQADQVTEQSETTTLKPSKGFWDYVLGAWKWTPIGFATHKLIELNNKKQKE